MTEPHEPSSPAVDVHQHLWPDELVDRLRARTRPPYLRGWTLHTDGEPPYDVDADGPRPRDPGRGRPRRGGRLSPASASPRRSASRRCPRPRRRARWSTAWHRGRARCRDHFRAWASVPATDPDLGRAAPACCGDPRFVGLQLPATQLLSPAAWERAARCCGGRAADKPVLVHPGPVPGARSRAPIPGWWAPVVGYVAQLQAAWWGWHVVRRPRRVPAAAAGVRAPPPGSRRSTTSGTCCAAARSGGRPGAVRRLRPATVRAPWTPLVRVLGIDAAGARLRPPVRRAGADAVRRCRHPRGPRDQPGAGCSATAVGDRGGELAWPFAS